MYIWQLFGIQWKRVAQVNGCQTMHELDTITSSTHIHVVNASYQLCDIWLTTVAFTEDYQLLVGMQVDSFDHQTQFTTYRLSTCDTNNKSQLLLGMVDGLLLESKAVWYAVCSDSF